MFVDPCSGVWVQGTRYQLGLELGLELGLGLDLGLNYGFESIRVRVEC